MTDLLPEGAAGRRRGRGLLTLVVFVAAQATLVAGAAIGLRRHGYSESLSFLLWMVPGLALAAWAFALFQRWSGRELNLHGRRLVFFLAFFPAVPLGDWLQATFR